jgi:hypothetical protein
MTTSSSASNGGKTPAKQSVKPEHGMTVLRDKEARALVGLACDALSEVLGVVNAMFGVIYGAKETTASREDLPNMRDEALTCLSTGEHYLLMLGSVLEDQAGTGRDPWDTRAPYPVYMISPEVTDGRG